MGIFTTAILAILFLVVALAMIWALKQPGRRDRHKKDYGLTDEQIKGRTPKKLDEEKKKAG